MSLKSSNKQSKTLNITQTTKFKEELELQTLLSNI